MKIRSGFSQGDEISDINVTPFVDVLLVLLIIFMITAPLVTKTISVQLPEETLNAPVDRNDLKLTLSVSAKGEYFHEDQKIELGQIEALANRWLESSAKPVVAIRADEKVEYRHITSLMSELKNHGIQNVGLIIKNPGT